MNISDFAQIKNKLNTSGFLGSDASLGNLFILQERYKITCRIFDDLLIRHFDFSDSIKGFCFPVAIGEPQQNYLESFITCITENGSKNEISLCLFSEQQKNTFDNFLSTCNSPYHIEWKTNRSDSDYIYLTEKLIVLSGSKLQKKKNHISQFNRHFKNTRFEFFDKSNFSKALYDDFVFVAESWISEHKQESEEHNLSDYYSEIESIKLALNNISALDYYGGILYVDDKPVAITLASRISDEALDIHFEKTLSQAAQFGGYAVINNLMAKHCASFHYINREEDLGIDGLRKAKLSYKPEIILNKFYGTLTKN